MENMNVPYGTQMENSICHRINLKYKGGQKN